MRLKVPSISAVMLSVYGIFQVFATFATFVPSFVHDRVPVQFMPTWRFLLGLFGADQPSESAVYALAVISQFIIGISEAIIAVTCLGAAILPQRRLALANFGLGYSVGLFGAFTLAMFAMHDKSLPAWDQYPAIFAWIGVIWLIVALTDKSQVKAESLRPGP